MRRHRINGFSLLRQWRYSCLATCQHACTCVTQKRPMDCRNVLLFCDVCIDIGMTLNLLQCLRFICGCRALQTNSVETSLALHAGYGAIQCHNMISSGSPPVFHECTSLLYVQGLGTSSCR